MKFPFGIAAINLAISIWIGFMIATAGTAIYPPLAQITAPFLCSTGKYGVTLNTDNYSPVASVTVIDIQCSDAKKDSQDDPDGFTIGLYSFVIYSAIAFIVLMICSFIWPLIFKKKITNIQNQ